jgi:hypothetical protein
MNADYWIHLVEASGEEGRAWLALYRSGDVARISDATDRAILLLRERRFERAVALLEGASADLGALRCPRPSIVHVLERWIHGVSAYQYYCIDDFERATRGMILADEAIRAAITHDRFLLPLAHHCQEFRLHHARIARNQGRFREMCEHVAIARGMIAGTRPLCELADGTRVDYAMIARHCEALGPFGDGARETVRAFSDDAFRRHALERFLLQIYLLPGFVIFTPPSS